MVSLAIKLAAADALLHAASLVERGWMQGELARDENGLACRPTDADATCWCAEGALRRATGFRGPTIQAQTPYEVAFFALTDGVRRRAIAIGSRNTLQCLPDWNDAEGRTAEEVAAIMRECAGEIRREVACG